MILKSKTNLSGLFVVFFLIILLPSVSVAEELRSVNDVDMINVIAYKKSQTTLYVSFLYKNYRNDKLVFWRDTSSEASCNVYELVGNERDKQKGSYIGSIKNHRLNDFSQGLYIDIVTTKEESGLVDCSWTFGGRHYNGNTTFSQRKIY